MIDWQLLVSPAILRTLYLGYTEAQPAHIVNDSASHDTGEDIWLELHRARDESAECGNPAQLLQLWGQLATIDSTLGNGQLETVVVAAYEEATAEWQNAGLVALVAQLALSIGQYTVAARLAARALELRVGGSAEAHARVLMATTCCMLDKVRQGHEQLRRVTAEPGDLVLVRATVTKGMLHQAEGKFKQALEALKSALSLEQKQGANSLRVQV